MMSGPRLRDRAAFPRTEGRPATHVAERGQGAWLNGVPLRAAVCDLSGRIVGDQWAANDTDAVDQPGSSVIVRRNAAPGGRCSGETGRRRPVPYP